jgi:hypothetical protein
MENDNNNVRRPKKIENYTWRGPLWRFEKLWELLGRWLFMGREAKKSNFSVFPIEVIFHITSVLVSATL